MKKENPLIINIEANHKGRDFVIGDLHGCYEEFKKLLNYVNFDMEKDRVFCVGDLIHRGPYPYKCLDLLKKRNKKNERWFFSTLGNHDDYFNQKRFETEKVNLENYKEEILQLPYIYNVEHPIFNNFYIVHGEINYDYIFGELNIYMHENKKEEIFNQLIGGDYSEIINKMLKSKTYILSERQRREIIWTRKIFTHFTKKNKLNISIGDFEFLFDKRNIKKADKLKIFCGHSVVPFPMMIGHQIYCDTGACFGYFKPEKIKSLSQWGNQFFSLSMIEINSGKAYSCITSDIKNENNIKKGDILTLNIKLYNDIFNVNIKNKQCYNEKKHYNIV